MTDNVRQAVFQAGIKEGRPNSFDKMATEVSTVARTRKENDVRPCSDGCVCAQGQERKKQGRQGQRRQEQDGKEMAKAKDDKDKASPKSNSNK